MRFILSMAWRDSRASRRRLVLFSLSIVLGIAALVSIGSFSTNLRRAVDDQAKTLLGADLLVVGREDFSPEVRAFVSERAIEQAEEQTFSSMAVFPGAEDGTRLVQVRAMEGRFPFYGVFETFPADAPERLRAGGDVAIVEQTLLRQFGVGVGDTVRLGQTTFTVVGELLAIPGESAAIALLAPRVFIPLATLEATGLVVPGQELLLRHRLLFTLPETVNPLEVERNLRASFPVEQLSVDTVDERRRELGRALERIEAFLSLVGFIALFLGAVGVASAMHVYVRQKINTVAVLRCIGSSARQSFAIYLVQGLALGFSGAVLGAALGIAVQLVLPALLEGVLPVTVSFFVAWGAVAEGLIAGIVISLLFTFLPLLAVRRVSPLVALRASHVEGMGPDPWRILIGIGIAAAVVTFAIVQTGEVDIGLGFAGMLFLGFALLAALARGVAFAARRWTPRRMPYVLRQGIANLHRPNNRTVLLLLSLGLGTFLILTLYLTRTTLLREIQTTDEGGRPNLLMFDVQDDQIEELVRLAAAEGAPVTRRAAIVTMRVAALRGQPVEELVGPGRGRGRGGDGRGPAGWTLRREYRSTYRGELTPTERLIEGDFIGQAPAGDPVVPISIERGLQEDMGVQIGDEITWDVQGVLIRSRVASVREVEWRQLEPNFFVVFPEGVLEGAPQFHVAAMRAESPAESARVQRVAVSAFPNITAIDLTLVMQTIDGILSKVSFVIEFMALFTVATGIIVLAGSVMTGRYQRIRETVLLRTLGATKRQLTRIQLVEYAILGLLAALMGCGLAVVGNGLLAWYVFDLPPVAPGGLLATAVLSVVAVTLTTGLLSSRGITNHPPLEVLRQET